MARILALIQAKNNCTEILGAVTERHGVFVLIFSLVRICQGKVENGISHAKVPFDCSPESIGLPPRTGRRRREKYNIVDESDLVLV